MNAVPRIPASPAIGDPRSGTDAVIIGEPKQVSEDGYRVVSAPITLGAAQHEVLYRVPEGPVATGAEPFLAAALLPAMSVGYPLRVPGSISPRLLETAARIQDIFCLWDPRLQRVPIVAQARESIPRRAPGDVACFFSGGVDSFYTLLKRRDEITTLLFVHGYDIPLHNAPLRAAVSKMVKEVAAETGKQLIEVETNVHGFSDRYADWGKLYCGAALASIALVLSPRFRKVYISASDSYDALLPWGSHPLLDPLWSTEDTEIVHDGCEARRIEKLSQICQDDMVCRTLRTCWENWGGAYNCGRCEKCLRTMAALRALGLLQRVRTFDRDVDLVALSRVVVNADIRNHFEQILRAVERQGNDPALARALRDCLQRKHHRGIRRLRRLVPHLANRFLSRYLAPRN